MGLSRRSTALAVLLLSCTAALSAPPQTEPTQREPETLGTYELRAPVAVPTIDSTHAYALVLMPPVLVMARLQVLDTVPLALVASTRPSYAREHSTAGNGPAPVIVSWRLPGRAS